MKAYKMTDTLNSIEYEILLRPDWVTRSTQGLSTINYLWVDNDTKPNIIWSRPFNRIYTTIEFSPSILPRNSCTDGWPLWLWLYQQYIYRMWDVLIPERHKWTKWWIDQTIDVSAMLMPHNLNSYHWTIMVIISNPYAQWKWKCESCYRITLHRAMVLFKEILIRVMSM